MKVNAALTTLATLTTLVSALPNALSFDKRQFNNGTFTNTTSSASGGAGVGAQPTGPVTTTVVQTVVSTVSQLYTTYPVTNLFTQTIVIPGGGAGVGAVPTGTGASGASPNNQGSSPNTPGSSPNNPNVVVVAGTGTGSAATCVCAPAVVATGLYTVTVQNIVDLGSTQFTTFYPTTTLGVITVAGGSIVPAVPTVTNSATIAPNNNGALGPNQSYQTITIPGTSTVVVLIVTVVTDVVQPVSGNNGGQGVGALPNVMTTTAPYSNSSTTATSLTAGATDGIAGLGRTASTSATSATASAASVGDAITPTAAPVSTVPAATTAPAGTPLAAGTAATQVGSLGTTPLYDQPAFINDILSYHNELRARNSAPAMTWNSALAQVALNNVNANAASGKFEHTYQMGISNSYGENIAYQSGQNNPEYLVYLWYEEYTKYSYDNPVFSTDTGHFTQLVWVDSTELGCAYAQSTSGTYYLACEYNPAGNYEGQFAANVLPANTQDAPAVPPTTI